MLFGQKLEVYVDTETLHSRADILGLILLMWHANLQGTTTDNFCGVGCFDDPRGLEIMCWAYRSIVRLLYHMVLSNLQEQK